MKIRAAILESVGADLEVREVDLSDPGPGEVLVRVTASGVCRSDLHIRNTGERVDLPVVLGHEGCGVVEAVGEGVESPAVGDTVVLSWTPECGHCEYCLGGRPNLCRDVNSSPAAGHLSHQGRVLNRYMSVASLADHAVVRARQAVPVPPELPPEQACLIGCGVMTGFGAAVNTAGVRPGATVAVFGAGGAGISAVIGARIAGATTIVSIDPEPRRLEAARTHGATHTIEGSGRDAVRQVHELTAGGADFAVECVGRAAVMLDAVNAVRPGGTAVVVGLPLLEDTVPMNPLLFLQEKTLRGSLYGSATPHRDFAMIARLALDGRIDLASIGDAVYPLDGVNEAIAAMERGEIVRPVISFGG